MRWVVGLCCAVLVAVGFCNGENLPNQHNGLIAASFTALGLFVVAKRPGTREGWLFVAVGLAHAVMVCARQYGFYADRTGMLDLPAVTWVTWLGVWPLALVLVLTGIT